MGLTAVLIISGAILYMFAMERCMRIFFQTRKTSFRVAVFLYALYPILNSVFVLLDMPLLNLAALLLSVFIILLNYEGTKLKKLAVGVAVLSIAITLEFVVVGIIVVFSELGVPFFAYLDILLEYGILMLVTAPLFFLSAVLLNFFFRNIKEHYNTQPFHWISSLVILFASIVIFTIVFFTYLSTPAEIVLIVTLLGINIFSFYSHNKLSVSNEEKLNALLRAQENESYRAQNQLMQDSIAQTNAIRHDMKIHLATLKGYSTKLNADEITNYLNKILDDIEDAAIYSDTGNIAVDSIINFKLKTAKQEGIKPDIRLIIPPALNIEPNDITTILGNLIDNALDAVSKVDEKMIKLDIEFSRESLFIQVENTYDGTVNYAEGVAGQHIITRKSSSGHGHGINNIKRSVEKYNGHIDIAYDDKIFTVTILLFAA